MPKVPSLRPDPAGSVVAKPSLFGRIDLNNPVFADGIRRGVRKIVTQTVLGPAPPDRAARSLEVIRVGVALLILVHGVYRLPCWREALRHSESGWKRRGFQRAMPLPSA